MGVASESNHPPFWAGLKFFNVYGPMNIIKEEWPV